MSPKKTRRGSLLFVVPLVSPERSPCWDRTQALFERTLRSICGQTAPSFHVVVACHEKPVIGFDHPAVSYLEVDHDVPPDDYAARVLDKKIKIRMALHFGRDLDATHSMNVDADDCVSRHLAEHVERHPDADGWVLGKGYFYSEKSGSLYLRRSDFHRWSGTSVIVKQGVFTIPEGLSATELQNEARLYDTYYVHHPDAFAELAKRGARPVPLPFPGAVYIVEHGSNLGYIEEPMYRLAGPVHRLKRAIFNYRRLTDRIRQEFGLYELP